MELGILTAICLGLTEVAKRVGLPSRFAPLVSIAIALAFNFLLLTVGEGNQEIVVNALIAGLSAAGLYSGTKAVVGGK